jgi:protein involved in polysaccharide export with SLBB domain
MNQLHINRSGSRERFNGAGRPERPLRRFAGNALRAAILALVLTSLSSFAQNDGEDLEPVFKAGETMGIQVPLDTASVLNGYYPVDTLGYVDIPVMGSVYVHNLGTREIENMIKQRMSAYMRDTHVTVTPVIRLALLGSWQKPGMYYVNSEASVWSACMKAGSPVFEKHIERWKVMRGTSEMPIVLADEFSRGTSLRKAGIRSGDIFVIPVPDPNAGFWYWFKESLAATAQVATIVTAAMTTYITLQVLDHRLYTTTP